MKSQSKIAIGTGASSILMIFVVLCLTTFGVLSYLTAQSDYKLTLKAVTNSKEYYEADSQAEEWLSKVDDYLYQAESSAKQYQEKKSFDQLEVGTVAEVTKKQVLKIYENQDLTSNEKLEQSYLCFVSMIVTPYPNFTVVQDEKQNKNLFYIVQVNDTYQIQTLLRVNTAETKSENRYQIMKRNLVSTKQWESDDLEVWGG